MAAADSGGHSAQFCPQYHGPRASTCLRSSRGVVLGREPGSLIGFRLGCEDGGDPGLPGEGHTRLHTTGQKAPNEKGFVGYETVWKPLQKEVEYKTPKKP